MHDIFISGVADSGLCRATPASILYGLQKDGAIINATYSGPAVNCNKLGVNCNTKVDCNII